MRYAEDGCTRWDRVHIMKSERHCFSCEEYFPRDYKYGSMATPAGCVRLCGKCSGEVYGDDNGNLTIQIVGKARSEAIDPSIYVVVPHEDARRAGRSDRLRRQFYDMELGEGETAILVTRRGTKVRQGKVGA